MQIDVWKGNWRLASIDSECLQILAFAKFSQVPFVLSTSGNPFWTKRGRLPVLRDFDEQNNQSIVLNDFKSIKKYFQAKGFNIDSVLSPKQISELEAYACVLQQSLDPALVYTWWLDEKNYTQVTRKAYAEATAFPFNFYYPGKYEQIAEEKIEGLGYPEPPRSETVANQILLEAEKCLTSLSNRLGNEKYFYGNQPSSLDALVYGSLAPLLQAPLVSTTLQNHLNACDNLVKFINRISQTYFVESANDSSGTTSQSSKTNKIVEEEFPHSTRNKFLAGFIATCIMFGYAVFHGIIQVADNTNETVDIQEILEDDDEL